MSDEIEKIERISVSESSKQDAEPIIERVAPDKEAFDALMKEHKNPEYQSSEGSSKVSLMDAVREANYNKHTGEGITPDSLTSQTQEAVVQIQEIKKLLATPELQIKNSAVQLLNNRLTHIDESLRVALSKTGSDFELSEHVPSSRINPIVKFVSLLTSGESHLNQLGVDLQSMGKKGELSPVDMLTVQVKMTQIQQELELFTSLLSKSLESIKTIMNVQV